MTPVDAAPWAFLSDAVLQLRRYWMAYSQQPHFASCGSRVQDKRISDKMPDAVAVPLPLPVVKSGAGALPSLGPISGVAVSPLDDTIWLLVRCVHLNACHTGIQIMPRPF